MKRINMHIIAMLTAAATALSLTGCANDTSARDRDDDDDSPRHSRTVDADENISSNSIADILGASNEVSSAPDAESNSENSGVESSNVESTTTASSTSEPETSVPDANVPGNTGSVDINDWPAGVATASPTAPSTPVPEADWAPLPTNEELLKLVTANFENAESFVMTCNIEGGFPKPHAQTHDEYLPVKHSYTYVVTRDTTYLKSTYQDLTTDVVPSVYEEYRIFEARTNKYGEYGAISTITKDGNAWIGTAPDEVSLFDMIDDTTESFSLIHFFDTGDIFGNTYTRSEKTTIMTAPITRGEDGSIVMTFPEWNERKVDNDRLMYDDYQTFNNKPFAGLIRFPEKSYELERRSSADGNVVYTFDNNYFLTGIEADIFVKGFYDIHVSIEFSNWNNVLPIEVPEYTVVEAE